MLVFPIVAYLLSISAINFIAILVYSISSFGNGLIFHMGWQICSRLSGGHVCNGLISTTNILVTLAALLVLPLQLYILRAHVDWSLACHLSITQQIGVFIGMYVAFSIHSDWIARGLGVSMFLVAIQKMMSEIRLLKLNENEVATSRYQWKNSQNYALVWVVGLSSGLFGGLYAAGGPPLMYFVASINLDKNVCRGTVAFLYLVENFARIIYILFMVPDEKALGIPVSVLFISAAVLTITSLIGLLVGNLVSEQINQRCFRYLILVVLGLGSVLLTTTGCSATYGVLVIVVSTFAYTFCGAYFIYQLNLLRRQTDKATNSIIEEAAIVTDGDDIYSGQIEMNSMLPDFESTHAISSMINRDKNHDSFASINYTSIETSCMDEEAERLSRTS